MKSLFQKYILDKKVLILGFGREGKSTLRFIRQHYPEVLIGIADKNINLSLDDIEPIDRKNLFLGEDYLQAINEFDVIIKSPGIELNEKSPDLENKILRSQTGLFLECYHNQIIGITGTKGKSTTSTLIHHILKNAGKKTIFVGNIGQPPFDLIHQIDNETHIVFELSAHQLEYVADAPHIAILLNIFQEHLDYFGTMEKYIQAKMNIGRFQRKEDFFIYDAKNKNIGAQLLKLEVLATKIAIPEIGETGTGGGHPFSINLNFENGKLRGNHNLKNTFAAALACKISGISDELIESGVESFEPLEHRLEFVGNFCGIDFYNDSISTIPESTMEAVKTLKNINTLILGGFDRGINYEELILFLAESTVEHFIFTGPAGKRMKEMFDPQKNAVQKTYIISRFNELPEFILKTEPGKSCLLSPAASSYDQFNNFEERGHAYKKMAESLKTFCH